MLNKRVSASCVLVRYLRRFDRSVLLPSSCELQFRRFDRSVLLSSSCELQVLDAVLHTFPLPCSYSGLPLQLVYVPI
jgi:hypothetical protein